METQRAGADGGGRDERLDGRLDHVVGSADHHELCRGAASAGSRKGAPGRYARARLRVAARPVTPTIE